VETVQVMFDEAGLLGEENGILTLLKKDGKIISTDIAKLPPDVYDLLYPCGIQSIAMLPVVRDGEYKGVVGITRANHRDWRPEELILLWDMGLMLGELDLNEGYGDARQWLLLTRITQLAGLRMCVSDVETHEILWLNYDSYNEREAGPGALKRKCHMWLEGCSQVCPFCRIPELKASPPDSMITFEHLDKRNGRKSLVYCGLSRWGGDRMACIEYSFDIGEYKKSLMRQIQVRDTSTAVVLHDKEGVRTHAGDFTGQIPSGTVRETVRVE